MNLLDLLMGTKGGWNEDVQQTGIRPDYGLSTATAVAPEAQSPHERTLAPGQERSREELLGMLAEVILAGAPVEGVTSPGRMSQNPAMRRTGQKKSAPISLEVVPDKSAYGNEIEMLPGGRLRMRFRGAGFRGTADASDHIRDQVSKIVDRAMQGDDPTFFRFTNNPKEIELARRGELKPSIHHGDNVQEGGLSVAKDPSYGVFGYKYGYRLKGRVVGTGSDGEPLIDPKSIQLVDAGLRRPTGLSSEYERRLAGVLRKMGWTSEQYEQALNASVSALGWKP